MPTATTKPPSLSPHLERLLVLPLFALPVLWLTGHFFPPINHDVGAVLYVSERWLAGDRLYVGIIDENLPLTFILHALPVLTAKFLPGGIPFWFVAWVVSGIIVSFLACRRLVHLIPSADHALTEALLPPVLLFLFTVLPNEHFGQREHIMFVMAAPYLLVSMGRAEGTSPTRRAAILVGLVAGIGFAMKPHYLAIPAAVELFLLTRRGVRTTFTDPLPWAIGLVAVAHLVLMYTVFWEFGIDRHAARGRVLFTDRRQELAPGAVQRRAGTDADRAADLRRAVDLPDAHARGPSPGRLRHRRGGIGGRAGQGLALPCPALPFGHGAAGGAHRLADGRPVPPDQQERASSAGGR